MSRWQIGRGEIRFWSSNWSGEIIDPISTSTLTVREAKNNMGLERTGLSETQIQALENIVLDASEEDFPIFTPTYIVLYPNAAVAQYPSARHSIVYSFSLI